jgi:hypothetical protein
MSQMVAKLYSVAATLLLLHPARLSKNAVCLPLSRISHYRSHNLTKPHGHRHPPPIGYWRSPTDSSATVCLLNMAAPQ